MKKTNCQICNQEFEWRGIRVNRFTCSKKCKYVRFGNLLRGIKRPSYIGKKISKSKLGYKYSEKARKNMKFSRLKYFKEHPEAKEKLRKMYVGRKLTLETKLKISKSLQKVIKRGSENHNWKGGVTPIYKVIRKSLKYKLWREEVFKRDNYICQMCNQRGGDLRGDHIKPFSLYPKLRFDIDNGRTLCESCHQKTDTYGSRVNNYFKLLK